MNYGRGKFAAANIKQVSGKGHKQARGKKGVRSGSYKSDGKWRYLTKQGKVWDIAAYAEDRSHNMNMCHGGVLKRYYRNTPEAKKTKAESREDMLGDALSASWGRRRKGKKGGFFKSVASFVKKKAKGLLGKGINMLIKKVLKRFGLEWAMPAVALVKKKKYRAALLFLVENNHGLQMFRNKVLRKLWNKYHPLILLDC